VLSIADGTHLDVIEIDGASNNGVEQVRDLRETARYSPAQGKFKVYIIDEVHMLSEKAFNAFLKTLEEPPPHAKFVFATTEIRKVPVTILSRCQRFDLRRVDAGLLSSHLAGICTREGVRIDAEALAMIARAAEGSVRDALSLLDQAIAHGAGTIEAETVRSMLGLADRGRIIDLFEAVMRGEVLCVTNVGVFAIRPVYLKLEHVLRVDAVGAELQKRWECMDLADLRTHGFEMVDFDMIEPEATAPSVISPVALTFTPLMPAVAVNTEPGMSFTLSGTAAVPIDDPGAVIESPSASIENGLSGLVEGRSCVLAASVTVVGPCGLTICPSVRLPVEVTAT
jgi:hypothetical protein